MEIKLDEKGAFVIDEHSVMRDIEILAQQYPTSNIPYSLRKRLVDYITKCCYKFNQQVSHAQTSLIDQPSNKADAGLTAEVNPAAHEAPTDIIEHTRKIVEDRQKLYSSSRLFAHEQLGKNWSGIISHWLRQDIPVIPGHIVALMLVEMKTTRAALEGFRVDDYADMISYASIAYDIRRDEYNM